MPRKTRETRAVLCSRFRVLCLDAGLDVDGVAKLLHVTPRTVRYWFSGSVGVPYAAYKLLRVMRLFELPCKGWDGWHMHSGKLWSPEGFCFAPGDASWWGLLVRQARGFKTLYDLEVSSRIAGREGDPLAGVGRGQQVAHPVGNTGITYGVTSLTGVAHG